ncbi:radical SAM protein [Candidatus Fermentibacteria bacterium]|nr:radical SAM protein [Candidatus Fermentibacteria bacterium]
MRIAFGPVPSRRLGKSLGINNIPPKICTYSCVYCQLGRTVKMQIERRSFYRPEELLQDVQTHVESAREGGEAIDYLTFVPDGEPTLDENLGRSIQMLGSLGVRIAVISNASLIWRKDVREELSRADWVSLKVDAATEETWRRVNRPQGRLDLESIRKGMLDFAESYQGELMTETMLVRDFNDAEETVEEVGKFLQLLSPRRAYLSVPIRPPAEAEAGPPSERTINRAYQVLSGHVEHVEYLIGYEGNEFAFTGNVEQDLLSITAVHPMREDAVKEFLDRANSDWTVVRKLIDQRQMVETEYEGHRFYLRKLS